MGFYKIMKPFHYHNTEHRLHEGKKLTRRVVIKGGKGYKSVTAKKGRKNHTVRRNLKSHEISHIKKGKFIPGLFNNCKMK